MNRSVGSATLPRASAAWSREIIAPAEEQQAPTDLINLENNDERPSQTAELQGSSFGSLRLASKALPPALTDEGRQYTTLDTLLMFGWQPVGLALQVYALHQKQSVISMLLKGPLADMIAERALIVPVQCRGGILVEVVFLIGYLLLSVPALVGNCVAFLFMLDAFRGRGNDNTGGHGPLSVASFRLLGRLLELFRSCKIPILNHLIALVDLALYLLWTRLGKYQNVLNQAWSLTITFNLIMYDMIITKLHFYGIWCTDGLMDLDGYMMGVLHGQQACSNSSNATTIAAEPAVSELFGALPPPPLEPSSFSAAADVIHGMQSTILLTMVTGSMSIFVFIVLKLKGTAVRCAGALLAAPCVGFFVTLVLLLSSYAYQLVHQHYVSQANFCATPPIILCFFVGALYYTVAAGFVIVGTAVWNPIGRLLQFLMVSAVADDNTAGQHDGHQKRRFAQHINWDNLRHCSYLLGEFISREFKPASNPNVVLMVSDRLVFDADIVFQFFQDPDRGTTLRKGYRKTGIMGAIVAAGAALLVGAASILWFVLLGVLYATGILPSGASWPWQISLCTVIAAALAVAFLLCFLAGAWQLWLVAQWAAHQPQGTAECAEEENESAGLSLRGISSSHADECPCGDDAISGRNTALESDNAPSEGGKKDPIIQDPPGGDDFRLPHQAAAPAEIHSADADESRVQPAAAPPMISSSSNSGRPDSALASSGAPDTLPTRPALLRPFAKTGIAAPLASLPALCDADERSSLKDSDDAPADEENSSISREHHPPHQCCPDVGCIHAACRRQRGQHQPL